MQDGSSKLLNCRDGTPASHWIANRSSAQFPEPGARRSGGHFRVTSV